MAVRHEPPRDLSSVLVLRLPAAVTFRMPEKQRSEDVTVDVVSVTEERDRYGNTPSFGLARIIRWRNSLAVSQGGAPCQSVRRSSSGRASLRARRGEADAGFNLPLLFPPNGPHLFRRNFLLFRQLYPETLHAGAGGKHRFPERRGTGSVPGFA